MKTKAVMTMLVLVLVALCGCASIEKRIRTVPAFNFESWSHSDRYALFTDTIVITGAVWSLNADGSATLTIGHYDGQAAWAGAVGPHDAIEKLVINFPPQTPQAAALRAGAVPVVPVTVIRP